MFPPRFHWSFLLKPVTQGFERDGGGFGLRGGLQLSPPPVCSGAFGIHQFYTGTQVRMLFNVYLKAGRLRASKSLQVKQATRLQQSRLFNARKIGQKTAASIFREGQVSFQTFFFSFFGGEGGGGGGGLRKGIAPAVSSVGCFVEIFPAEVREIYRHICGRTLKSSLRKNCKMPITTTV